MHQLSEALKSYISSRISSDSLWKDIMVWYAYIVHIKLEIIIFMLLHY
jgi:5'-3' exonuclease